MPPASSPAGCVPAGKRDEEEIRSLVERARQGDASAFEQLYRLHAGRVYALCLRLSADRGRAEELTQDVFVRAWQHLDSFRGDAVFSSWLHRLAVNVVLADFRSARRRLMRLFGTDDLEPYDRAGAAEPAAERMDLERAIQSLPRRARAVFVLHDVEGYHHDEIGALLGVAEGTCKAQLHRARRLLRERLNR